MLPRRIRAKASPTTADPAWGTDNLSPNRFEVTIGGTTDDGIYAIDIVPEDGSATLSIEFDRQAAETDGDIGDELETEGTTLIATTLASYLIDIVSDGAGVLTCRVKDNAPPFRVETRAPGTGTATLDLDDCFPIVDRAFGKGQLFVEFVAVNASGVPLAPASGTLDVAIVHVVDRQWPQGPRGNAYFDAAALPAVTSTDETSAQPLGQPLIVDAPAGVFTVTITGGASMPVGTDNVEVWCSLVDA